MYQKKVIVNKRSRFNLTHIELESLDYLSHGGRLVDLAEERGVSVSAPQPKPGGIKFRDANPLNWQFKVRYQQLCAIASAIVLFADRVGSRDGCQIESCK